MTNNYWDKISSSRLSRRRLIGAGAMVGMSAAALSLLDCGGSSSSNSSSDSSKPAANKGPLTSPADTTASAKQGGTYGNFLTSDIATFDPQGSDNIPLSSWVQSRLQMAVPTKLANYDGKIQGDLSDSWEISPDGLQWTFKIRGNATFPNLPGNTTANVDAQDVLYSYNRYLPLGEYRSAFSNALSPAGAVTSVAAPDNRTFVMKLAFPFGSLSSLLQEHFFIYPRLADGKYEPKQVMLGSGPWQLDQYQGSSFLNYKRNPGWHFNGKPYMEKVTRPIITEYATRLSEFRAHRISANVLNQPDILPTKKDLPNLNLYSLGYKNSGHLILIWGFKGDSPFKDERVRQAASMAIDRDTLIDVNYNVTAFKAAGLDDETRWYTHIGLAPDRYWLDPKGKDFGPNAKYFKFDPAEAKKLQSAAGFPTGIKTQFNRAPSPPSNTLMQGMGMLHDNLGWDIKDNVTPSTGLTPAVLDTRGDFDGFSWSNYTPKSDPTIYMFQKYNSNGSSGRMPKNIDPQLDKFFDDLYKSTDESKKIALWHQTQQYLGEKWWTLPFPGQGYTFDLAWPDLKNYAAFGTGTPDTDGTEQVALNYWIDPTAT